MDANPAEVGAADLERSLDLVCAQAAGPAAGLFGPGSAMWQVDREAILFLGAGRALLLQLAHPWVAAAIAEHSSALADPIGRFHRTFDTVFSMVFGTLEQALAASRRLHRRHAEISGRMPASIGPYPEGSPYLANEVAALMWVHATLIDTALAVHDLVLPPLGREARERYYADCRRIGLLFGIPLGSQPADWAAFAAYMEASIGSDRLEVGPEARDLGTRVLGGAGRLPVPRWYRAVTATLMPEPLRSAFGLPFGEAERRRANRALKIIRRGYPVLPARLRYVGPYQEAVGRLSGRGRPDLLTRFLNRLWIGRSAMSD
jgi:uncharacterized protein (DUF2236 family)